MKTKKHIFEVKQLMNGWGWSCITAEEFAELDFFTKQYIMSTIDDSENFKPEFYDIELGNGSMFWFDPEIEGEF
jgi:hypothetical protein